MKTIKEWVSTFEKKEVKITYTKSESGAFSLDKYTKTKYGELEQNIYWCRGRKADEMNSQKKAKRFIGKVFEFELFPINYDTIKQNALLEKLGFNSKECYFERKNVNYNIITEELYVDILVFNREKRNTYMLSGRNIIINEAEDYLIDLIENETGKVIAKEELIKIKKIMERK